MELNQTSICYYDKRLAGISSCTESSDSIVPDTFPDIGRVICAYGTAAVKDRTPQNGRLLISGAVQTTILYQPENAEGLRRLSVPISFAYIEECDGMDADAVCYVSCRVAAVDAVPVNSRKLNVSAQLCFEVECYCKADCQVTEGVELPQIQMLRTPHTVTVVQQAHSCPITILEDVTLQDANDLQLLHTACTLKSTECRAMRGKVVLKGEAVLQCLALQEDDAVRVLSNSTPFTQILEIPDLEESDPVSVRLAAHEVDCRLESDGLLSYTISAEAAFTVRGTKSIQQIDDMYIPGKTLQIQEEKAALHSMPPLTPFAAEVNETLQTAQHVSHIIHAGAVCCGAKRNTTTNTLQLTVAVQVLYLNDEQQLSALQRTLPLTASCTAMGELSQIELNARAAAAGETGLLLSVAVSGMAALEERCVFRNITALEESEAPKNNDGVTLVLRYIDQEQALWEVAKSCGTTMEAIRRANDLPPDAVSASKTMLLIPIQA